MISILTTDGNRWATTKDERTLTSALRSGRPGAKISVTVPGLLDESGDNEDWEILANQIVAYRVREDT